MATTEELKQVWLEAVKLRQAADNAVIDALRAYRQRLVEDTGLYDHIVEGPSWSGSSKSARILVRSISRWSDDKVFGPIIKTDGTPGEREADVLIAAATDLGPYAEGEVMGALETALAEIEAEGRAAAAHRAKVNADSRIIYLRKVCEETSHNHMIVSNGWAGFHQMATYMASSMSPRHSRAGASLRARLGQLGGFRKQASHNLECAARAHTEELFRRAKEQIDTSLRAVDATLAGTVFQNKLEAAE